jgi:tetratricopeptide (TPR) repeat protein
MALTLKIAYSNARQRWPDVQAALLTKIKAEGETAELDRAIANALFQQNQDAKAREMFLRADKLSDGKGLPADAAMSQLYAARGDLQSAKQSLDAALKANPKSTPVLLLSINNALAENDLDAAWKLVQQLYQEDKSVEVLKTYGRVALFRSDYRRAEAAFQEAVQQSPLDTDASNGLALALCEQGDEEKNKRAVQYAAGNVQKQQNNRDFLATLGWVLYRTGQPDEAIQVLQQSTADGQINAASAYYFAVVLNDKGQTEQAKNFLEAALSTQPPFAKRTEAEALLKKLQ